MEEEIDVRLVFLVRECLKTEKPTPLEPKKERPQPEMAVFHGT